MVAELTDEQIEHAWDIYVGPANEKYPLTASDIRGFARAILALATQQATQGAEPVGKLIVSRPFQDYHPGPPAFDLPDGEHPIYTAPPPTAEVEKDAIPEGCTPADARVLREANHLLAETEQRLRRALRFYAAKYHFGLSDHDAWDTVSGEPTNFWCDEAGTATVEDGWVAQAALRGEADDWGEDGPPPLCPGEPEHIMLAALQSDQAQAGKGDGHDQ